MLKRFFPIILLVLIFPLFLITPKARAAAQKQVTIVNPIRGSDFWANSYSILDTPEKEYALISQNNLPATWLVRYDALKDPQVESFLKSLNSQQEVGLFLEVTPTLARDAGVKYNASPDWHYAKSVLLIGYSPSDRQKLIDTAAKKYLQIFGQNPKSVGAWWIDAYSLDYLRQKYGVSANLDVSDQYTTDQYSVWGQYFSTPFYPSKQNALMPAQSADQKIGLVTIQWATRDPYNSYGSGVNDSTYSVQVNDYQLHNLGIDYFQKLLAVYPQVSVGLENDFSWSKYGQGYSDQIALLSSKRNSLGLKTMSSFSAYYQSLYPDISPNVLISADDPLGSGGKVVWYNTPFYRAGWFYNSQGSVIRDLRTYNDSIPENCFDKACDSLNLALPSEKDIDDVTFSTNWLIDQGSISNFSVSQDGDSATISYDNQAGRHQAIQFLKNDVRVDDKTVPVSTAILNAVTPSPTPSVKAGSNVNTSLSVRENFPIIWDFIKFIFLTLFFFFLPGYILSRSFVVAIPLGWVIFTLLSFILGYLKLDILLWGVPVVSLAFLRKVHLRRIEGWKKLKKEWLIVGLILLGSLSWCLTVLKSGLIYRYGLGFWGPNGHDAIWHLSLISELMREFPPKNPVFAGVNLSNYHYFFDLLIAQSANLLNINPISLLMQFFPIVLAVLAGSMIYISVKKIFNHGSALWAIFFVYFGGSFGWVLSYFKSGDLGGESTFWAQQAVSTLLNPPFAISIVIFLSGLYLFWDFLKLENFLVKKNWRSVLVISLLWGSLVEFKVYAGVIVLGALGLLTLEKIIRKRDFKLLAILIPSGVLAGAVFLPNNSGANSLLYFSPFWLISSMISFPDRLGWQRLSLTINSGNPFKVIAGYGLGFLIFLVGNLGTRVIGFLNWRDFLKARFLIYAFLIGLVLPMIFIQVGTNWNIVQFFYYSILIFDIFAGVSLFFLLKRLSPLFQKIVVIAVLILTLPTSFNVLKEQYLGARPPAMLPLGEYQALNFLKSQPSGVVLTLPFDPAMTQMYNAPVPLYAYTSTAYVSAFSNHPVFLEDSINLDILGVDYKGRLDVLNDFTKLTGQDKEILKSNNISYVYLPKAFKFQVDEGRMGLKKIFENDDVEVFRVL